jgi:glycosyltransferase involved in cell wall biosynthesis
MNANLKVLYIVTSADGGGAQKYVLDLAQHFGGDIAAGTQSQELYDQAARAGVKTHPLHHLKREVSPRHDFLAIFEIAALIRRIKPDLVHLNSSKAGFLGSLAGRMAGTRVLFTAHGFFYFKRAPWLTRTVYAALEKFASLFRDQIIAVSDEDKNQALEHGIIQPAHIATVHNGISPVAFLSKADARNTLNLDPARILTGCIAQLYNRKAIDVLIEAVALLPNEIRGQFVVLGDGPEQAALEALIAARGLQENFLLMGFVPNAVSYLKGFDLFVLSSRREGFPYVILEALQAGLPIVATNVGGVAEALAEAGFLVNPDAPAELAAALTQVLGALHRHGTEHFSELSRQSKIRGDLFTKEKMLLETEHVYRTMMNRDGHRVP